MSDVTRYWIRNDGELVTENDTAVQPEFRGHTLVVLASDYDALQRRVEELTAMEDAEIVGRRNEAKVLQLQVDQLESTLQRERTERVELRIGDRQECDALAARVEELEAHLCDTLRLLEETTHYASAAGAVIRFNKIRDHLAQPWTRAMLKEQP